MNTNLINVSTNIIAFSKKSSAKSFHSHAIAQLTYTVEGVMYVSVKNKLWIVPPNMAIFIPKNIDHKQEMHKNLTIKSLYLPDVYVKNLSKQVQLLQLTELARAIISRICTLEPQELNAPKSDRLLKVLIDELQNHETTEYAAIPLPESRQLYKIYQLFRNCKDRYPSIEETAKFIHVSNRTLLRLFKKETGMSFVVWKQQFLFIKAIELLQYYKNIGIVAYKLGYKSDSAFIAMFKKMSGNRLPSQFYRSTSG